MKVIVLVAGSGSRMRPHTITKPKAILNIAGKPGIFYILSDLEKLKVSEVVFIVGHLGDEFERFIKGKFDFKMTFLRQSHLNGTAGATLIAEKCIDEPVLIVLADALFEVDFSILKNLPDDVGGVIWAEDMEDIRKGGECIMDSNGFLKKIVEKPTHPVSDFGNIGLYYIKDYKLLFEGIHHIMKQNESVNGEYSLSNAFQYMIDLGVKMICPIGRWHDYGKPEKLIETSQKMLVKTAKPFLNSRNSIIIDPVFISEDAIIENSIVGPNVVIEPRCSINNSIIRNSLICKNSKIDSILLDHAIIGDNAEIEGEFKNLNIGDHSIFKEKK